MSRRREFEIAFVGLKPGVHEFNFDIDDKFFVEFQQQDFQNCKAHVKLLLDKNGSFMMLKFEIGGTLDVVCDRCSNQLPLDLWDEFKMTVKMAEEPELLNQQEDDPDVYYISHSESHINVAGWIYEFINLSLPMQKTCQYENMDGPHCNPDARNILKNMEQEKQKNQENPIWKGLEKFKDLDS